MNTQRVIMQVPLSKELKTSSEAVARDMGFSSLQEAIRVLLQKLATHQLTLKFQEPVERLSPKAERRYIRMLKEIKEGKGITHTGTIDELMDYLNA